jgi:hypothetical protein
VSLTEDGEKATARVNACRRAELAAVLEPIPPRRRRQLVKVLTEFAELADRRVSWPGRSRPGQRPSLGRLRLRTPTSPGAAGDDGDGADRAGQRARLTGAVTGAPTGVTVATAIQEVNEGTRRTTASTGRLHPGSMADGPPEMAGSPVPEMLRELPMGSDIVVF